MRIIIGTDLKNFLFFFTKQFISVLFKYNSTRIRTICLLYLYVTFTYSQYQMADQISSISRLGSYKTIIFIGVAKTIGYLGSAYASLNNPRKETLKNVIVITAAFTVFILLWPYIFVVHRKGGIKELDHFGYSIVLMVLVISRIVISFGFSFLNVLIFSYYFILIIIIIFYYYYYYYY